MFNTEIDFWFSACRYFTIVCWILIAVVFFGVGFFIFNKTLGKGLEEKACDSKLVVKMERDNEKGKL